MELARLKAIQVNDTVVVHFTENGYKVFKDDGPTSGQYDAGEEIYGDRTLPAGVKIDLDKTNFEERECPLFRPGHRTLGICRIGQRQRNRKNGNR